MKIRLPISEIWVYHNQELCGQKKLDKNKLKINCAHKCISVMITLGGIGVVINVHDNVNVLVLAE